MAELIAKTGANAGQVFALNKDLLKLGRNRENDLVLSGKLVSRFHAQLIRRDHQLFVIDLKSTHGTFVNNKKIVAEKALQNNDLLRVGDALLLFRGDKDLRIPEPSEPIVPVHKEITETATEQTLDDRTIAFSIPSVPSPSDEDLSGHRLEVLTKVATAIQSVHDLEELLNTLMDVLFDIFRPDRGVILLRDSASGEMVRKVSRPVEGDFKISNTIVQHASTKRMSVLVADTAGDNRFSDALSIKSQSIQAAICCPLVCKDKVLGVLYLDTQVNLFAYQEDDLALLNIIAANAAMVIENAILISEKFQAQRLAADEIGPVVADSPAMQKTMEQIKNLAALGPTAPILISGESGAGKFFAAQTLHKMIGNFDAPFLTIDCGGLSPLESRTILFGSSADDQDFLEASDDDSTGPASLEESNSAIYMAHGGTLVLRHIDALDPPAQQTLSRYLKTLASGEKTVTRTHLIATTCEDLASKVETDGFHPPLIDQFKTHRLEMPRMMERKKDTLALARYFLSHRDQSEHDHEHRLNQSAEFALRKLQFRHRNAAELREAIEFSALIAEGLEIGAEHIFTGPKDSGFRIEYDISQNPLLRLMSNKTGALVLQGAVMAFFTSLVVLCLTQGGTVYGDVANGLIWGLWWPALIFFFLFLGRVWCPFCPISAAGRLAGKIYSMNRMPSPWIKKHTGWIMAFMFLAIIWSEHVFQMTEKPFATGIFLLTLVTCSTIFCVVHQREVWCRYFCPLGSLSASYSVPSVINVHATPSICASQCKTHECFRGAENETGCPMFHHPLYIRDAHFCKLCFKCLRSCQHHSVKPYIRPLLQDVWRQGDLSVTLAPFALTAFFISLVMLASQQMDLGTQGIILYSGLTLLALALAVVSNAFLPSLLSREGDQTIASRSAFALLLMAWGGFMAFHLENIPGMDELRLGVREWTLGNYHFSGLDLSIRDVLQFGSLFLAAFLAGLTFWRLRVYSTKQGAELSPWGYRFLLTICAIYLMVSLTLLWSKGDIL